MATLPGTLKKISDASDMNATKMVNSWGKLFYIDKGAITATAYNNDYTGCYAVTFTASQTTIKSL